MVIKTKLLFPILSSFGSVGVITPSVCCPLLTQKNNEIIDLYREQNKNNKENIELQIQIQALSRELCKHPKEHNLTCELNGLPIKQIKQV